MAVALNRFSEPILGQMTIQISDDVRVKMAELARSFREWFKLRHCLRIPTVFVRVQFDAVFCKKRLFEAILLVVLLWWLFIYKTWAPPLYSNWVAESLRWFGTLLLCTCLAFFALMPYRLFGLVLGDWYRSWMMPIVVKVENVEVILLGWPSPVACHEKAMQKQVTGPIVADDLLVLAAQYLSPTAFMVGLNCNFTSSLLKPSPYSTFNIGLKFLDAKPALSL